MPTEKFRYLNRGPSTHLRGFEHERLVELLWMSVQNNSTLWKALMASVSIQGYEIKILFV